MEFKELDQNFLTMSDFQSSVKLFVSKNFDYKFNFFSFIYV